MHVASATQLERYTDNRRGLVMVYVSKDGSAEFDSRLGQVNVCGCGLVFPMKEKSNTYYYNNCLR